MMPALYTASVPVFLHYFERIEGLVARTGGDAALLRGQLAPDMFTAGQQMATAVNFALRVAYPLAGRAVPVAGDYAPDAPGVMARLRAAETALNALDPVEFEGAETRLIRHRAGFAELEQTGADFLHLFGMPNFLFHTCMAFAVLRAGGLEIGKADFDGQHDYPHGFRF